VRLALVAALLVTVLGFAGGARAADDPYAALLAPAGTCGAADEQLGLDEPTARLVMACLTNYARARSGLAPLQLSATLSKAGDAKLAADVACNAFSHEPCGRPFDTVFADYLRGAAGYRIGENIAWGTGSYGTPRSIMDAWLHSAGHRENILTAGFTEIGIGFLPDQQFQGWSGAQLWSQQFGTRTPAAAAPPKPVVKKKHRQPRKRLAHRRS
jgi:hypothetical protein